MPRFEPLDPVTKDTDLRSYWRALGPLVRLYNALINPQIHGDTGKEDVQLSDGNFTIEYQRGGGGGGAGGGGDNLGTGVFAYVANGQIEYAEFGCGPGSGSPPAGGAVRNPY